MFYLQVVSQDGDSSAEERPSPTTNRASAAGQRPERGRNPPITCPLNAPPLRCMLFFFLCVSWRHLSVSVLTEFLVSVWVFLFLFHVHAAFCFLFHPSLLFLSSPVCSLMCRLVGGWVVPLFLLLLLLRLSRWRAVWSCRTPWPFGSGTMRPLRLSNRLKSLPLHLVWYVEELPVLWTPTSTPHPPLLPRVPTCL